MTVEDYIQGLVWEWERRCSHFHHFDAERGKPVAGEWNVGRPSLGGIGSHRRASRLEQRSEAFAAARVDVKDGCRPAHDLDCEIVIAPGLGQGVEVNRPTLDVREVPTREGRVVLGSKPVEDLRI